MTMANAPRVFSTLLGWIDNAPKQGGEIWLATVVETYGSSPRPVGSLMAVRLPEAVSESPDPVAFPEIVGSISGGCLEQDLIERLQQKRVPLKPQLIMFGQTSEEQHRYQLPCGGSLNILLEPVAPSATYRSHIESIVSALQQRLPVARRVSLPFGEKLLDSLTCHVVTRHLCDEEKQSHSGVTVAQNNRWVCHTLCPDWRLLILGAGEVANYLAAFAAAANFDVSVCEPREQYAAHWQGSATLYRRLPDELITCSFYDACVAIVGVSHDPRVDDMGLMAALDSAAFFIGCMGSEKTSAARRERLRELGVSEASLRRLHAPVGLDVGSKTPAEIAISVVAQLIAKRSLALPLVSSLATASADLLQEIDTNPVNHGSSSTCLV